MLTILHSLAMLAAGLRMFRSALGALVYSPVSFFDTTPMGMVGLFLLQLIIADTRKQGRIITRVSKDQDTVDNELFFTSYFVSHGASVLSIAS